MARLIIDISELANWTGKLTGVPRVMNELSWRYANQEKCEFVTWDNGLRNYVRVDFPLVKENEKSPVSKIKRDNKLTKGLKYIKRKSPLLHKSYLLSKQLVTKTQTSPLAISTTPAFEINEGDVLFIMADWHGSDAAFIQKIIGLHARGVKLVQISYDMLPIVAPQYSGHATKSFTNYVEQIYPLCNVIFAISKQTKSDIGDWLKERNLRVPEIEIMRLGDDFKKAQPIKPTNDNFGQTDKYSFLLCVGTIEARKNHTLLYYMYKLAQQRGIELPDMVVVGRRGWLSGDIYEIITTDPATKDRFTFLHDTNDEELSWLYNNCSFSIYPSFYEGWGLPIAESIAYGVPCLASNTSSMPEIAGPLIDYFSPASADECLQAVVNLLHPAEFKKAKQRIESYEPTSWDETFKHVSAIVGKVDG